MRKLFKGKIRGLILCIILLYGLSKIFHFDAEYAFTYLVNQPISSWIQQGGKKIGTVTSNASPIATTSGVSAPNGCKPTLLAAPLSDRHGGTLYYWECPGGNQLWRNFQGEYKQVSWIFDRHEIASNKSPPGSNYPYTIVIKKW